MFIVRISGVCHRYFRAQGIPLSCPTLPHLFFLYEHKMNKYKKLTRKPFSKPRLNYYIYQYFKIYTHGNIYWALIKITLLLSAVTISILQLSEAKKGECNSLWVYSLLNPVTIPGTITIPRWKTFSVSMGRKNCWSLTNLDSPEHNWPKAAVSCSLKLLKLLMSCVVEDTWMVMN